MAINPLVILAPATVATVARFASDYFERRYKKARKMKNDNSVRSEAPCIYAKLQRAHIESLIDDCDYSYWDERLWDAQKDFDCEL